MIYLDNNATTALDPLVTTALLKELEQPPSNPSSIHHLGKEAKSRLHQAKSTLANYLKVHPDTLFFTASGTEALNLAIKGFFLRKKGVILSTKTEHAAIYETILDLEKAGCTPLFLETGLQGAVSFHSIEEALQKQRVDLIVLSAVNSETGVKTDIEAIASLADRFHVPFVVDGVALLGKADFTIPNGVSAMAFSGHKIHAPKGIGLLYKKPSFTLSPLITGGGQEKNLRSGTENLAGAIAFAKAVELFYENKESILSHLTHLQKTFLEELNKRGIRYRINGLGEKVSNTINLTFEGVDGETLLTLLDMNGIQASHGSACSSGAIEPSRVLLAMGLSKEVAKGSIRFSFSRLNTEEEIKKAVAILSDLIRHLSAIL